MIARHATRGAALASFVALQASLALAQPAQAPNADPAPDAKRVNGEAARTAPADVKPADVKLEETAPAADAPSSRETGAPAASAEVDGDSDAAEATEGTDDAEAKKSPGLEFIKTRRKAAKTEARDDVEPEDDAEEHRSFRAGRERDERPEPDDGLLGTHQEHFFLGIGPRVGFIDDDGLDPFSTTDAFTQVAILGGRTIYTDGNVSVAALIEWNYGERAASARGLDASIGVHRMSLGAEGRYHFIRRLFGYVRLSPGALYTWAKMNQLETDTWAFSADASLGAAFEVFGAKAGETNKPRGWVSVNGGYGFGTETDLTLSPAKRSRSPERTASLDLGTLSLSGPFVGGAVSLSY